MRMIVTGIAFAVVALAAATEANAQRQPRPWCFRGGEHSIGGGLLDCSYQTLAQCRATATLAGEGCEPNPALGWDRLEGKGTRQPPRRVRERGY